MADARIEELSLPTRYIERVSLSTGEPLDGEIKPEELLVRKHRDYHVVDIYARHLMSAFMKATGDEEKVRGTMRKVREFGMNTADFLAKLTGMKDPEKISRALFGLRKKDYYFRFKKPPYTKEQLDARLKELKAAAHTQIKKVSAKGRPRLRVLLTGGTGFVGKELIWQASTMVEIEEMIVLIRPKTIRDRKSGKVTRVLSPEERGKALLEELWLDKPEQQAKFRFVEGDIEEPRLGVSNLEFERLQQTVTHTIHCAASVAFDSPYEDSFVANVLGTLNALSFSEALQNSPDSPFVCHLAIETSYIHGRQRRQEAREDEIVFPRNFYNNYYELTKAMASIETERYMLEKNLRVVQLCPSIVIGQSDTGNNRGDTKVVNAPVNAFGRAKQHLKDSRGDWLEWSKAWMLFRMAATFPGDPSAELNLIPVDWVASGILQALVRPAAVGERIHLATDRRMTAERMRVVILEELGVDIKLAEPTLHRTVQLPMLTTVLGKMKQKNLARALEKLGTIFGGYSEWGQPIHQVGNDVEVLGMPTPRPNTEASFRMLCRHNKFVQRFGMVKDPDELSRREKLWTDFIRHVEREFGNPAGVIEAAEFRMRFYETFDPETFELRQGEKAKVAP